MREELTQKARVYLATQTGVNGLLEQRLAPIMADFALDYCKDLVAERDRLREQLNELHYEVAQHFPGETRHQTAVRYIRERENRPPSPPAARRPDDQ